MKMKKRNATRIVAMLVTVMMVVGLLPALPGMSTTVYAAEPSVMQFATKDELKSSFNLDASKLGTAQKVYFGQNSSDAAQTWYIAGSDTEEGLILMCDVASPLATNQVFNSSNSEIDYDSAWGCTYASEPSKVYSNHYGSSALRAKLNELATATQYFSTSEQALMRETTIITNDTKSTTTYTTTDKLYAAYGDFYDDAYITVGTNTVDSLNGGLRIELKSGPYKSGGNFGLRSPHSSQGGHALRAIPGTGVSNTTVDFGLAIDVVPAFNLNLSSVLFASAAPAALSEGALTISDAMTLRYDAGTALGSADIFNPDQKKVAVNDAPAGTYLVVQNDVGAWTKAVSGNSTVSASDVTIGGAALDSFADCKVWLETTNADRITTATMALPHTHTFAAEWATDETNHWHSATCIHTDATDSLEAHDFGDWVIDKAASETEKGSKHRNCGTCAYKETVDIPVLQHTHKPATDWSKDETSHWHECTANDGHKMDVANHAYGEWVVDTEATETEKGSKHRDCAVCGQSETEEIPAIGETPAKPTIAAGAGSNHQIGSDKDMTLTCSGRLEDLSGIYVDGKLVGPSNYTLKSGSTILTLKASYLDTLSAGNHTLKFQYKDNVSAETDFTITAKAGETPTTKPSETPTTKPNAPQTTKSGSSQTGDSSNFMVLFTLLLASGGTLTALLARRRRTGRH